MAGYTAIADVGDTLVELLRDRMADLVDADDIALVSPAEEDVGNDYRLTLYLYQIAPNEHLTNAERHEIAPDRERPPPLALDLYYLLTANPSTGGGDETAKTREQHSVLGRAMQVLQDNSILRGSDLRGSLAGESDIGLSVNRQSLNEVVSIWNTFDERAYEPSVSYVVTPVFIESTREVATQRVVERREDYSMIHDVRDDE